MGGYSSIDLDYLLVAGGGGQSSAPQGANREAGSGAGGLLSSHPDVPATFRHKSTISPLEILISLLVLVRWTRKRH